jgi:hypothetical protein
MHYDLGYAGLGILVGFALGFGAIAQLIFGRERGTPWLWLVGALGWFAGGFFASEVLVGTMTIDEIQPILDGLAFDEALGGGLLGGLAALVAVRLLARTGRRRA